MRSGFIKLFYPVEVISNITSRRGISRIMIPRDAGTATRQVGLLVARVKAYLLGCLVSTLSSPSVMRRPLRGREGCLAGCNP